MTEPKRINITYVGDGSERVIGTSTGTSGVVHGIKRDGAGYAHSLCGWARWQEYYGAIPDYDESGKFSDITCKKCLRSLKKPNGSTGFGRGRIPGPP